ncbi:hypothetical protein [Rhodospirillum rubrum]|uniref:Prepilin-type N-terminal cleavage/methylation domain-containing protein n=1 Tax=Rhodospirillum rubrum (strain ATCC 11170 / ATH 1.1.1 / DSM 467 / LMG 4362 / NCIMB 8255 / S1) TaxID=269796 RepID=Q2RY69_RHORT|nr:hypothetical protein [Rhodospirillum rubrum]ABC20926.1 hypothetical protein Rru_A0121 [Rhodospirillum rubrum ATCC 11170]AEO46594.1 hypothetical protein F11_00615 [Rhodospirillum rubrum F11]MBK5952485.1 hypothetical protein [Rhodospirillum rubrum]QXG80624.1 hypothetical protein KUL73_00615 [Rhodospirillum rubrum]
MISRKGGALIEIALALALIGLVLAAGLRLLPAWIEGTRRQATLARMARVDLALLAHLERTGSLPCPAEAENSQTPGAGGACGPAAPGRALFVVGTVPWAPLGLMPTDTIDGWGNRLTYAASLSLVTTALSLDETRFGDSAAQGAIPVLGADPTIRPAALDRAALALISAGPNGAGAITRAGGRRPAATNPAEAANTPPAEGTVRFDAEGPAAAGLHAVAFDDIVHSRTPWALLRELGHHH